MAFSELPAHLDGQGNPTPVRFKPGAGFTIDLSWQIFRTLRFTAYMIEHFHALDLPPGALGVAGTIAPASMHGYSFGVRFSPTVPLGTRGRIWMTAGGGWGYLGYPDLTVTQLSRAKASTRPRSSARAPRTSSRSPSASAARSRSSRAGSACAPR